MKIHLFILIFLPSPGTSTSLKVDIWEPLTWFTVLYSLEMVLWPLFGYLWQLGCWLPYLFGSCKLDHVTFSHHLSLACPSSGWLMSFLCAPVSPLQLSLLEYLSHGVVIASWHIPQQQDCQLLEGKVSICSLLLDSQARHMAEAHQ